MFKVWFYVLISPTRIKNYPFTQTNYAWFKVLFWSWQYPWLWSTKGKPFTQLWLWYFEKERKRKNLQGSSRCTSPPEASESILKNMHYHRVIFKIPMDSLKWFWPTGTVLISCKIFGYWAFLSTFSKKGIKKRKSQF